MTREVSVSQVDRRNFLKAAAALAVQATAGCRPAPPATPAALVATEELPPVTVTPLQMPWQTQDPFLFCVHHLDAYPKGNAEQGPAEPLDGRHLGQDFSARDGWSMYHGRQVPGFPRHPHRGFETITVTRQGLVDHSDSLGATARYGDGDVQWMTAGRGIVHAEMFPLRDLEAQNPTELFQIWLNLPAQNKFSAPSFTMFWHETLPVHRLTDRDGRSLTLTTLAGELNSVAPPTPPPKSWAADPKNEVAIWTIDLEPGATWTLPAASPGLSRNLYFYRGDDLDIAGTSVLPGHRVTVESHLPVPLRAGAQTCQLLLLQGRPIGEAVVQHGPFVMNSRDEIRDAYRDYQRQGFGGWPWPTDAPVHPRDQGRFALHPDGRRDTPA